MSAAITIPSDVKLALLQNIVTVKTAMVFQPSSISKISTSRVSKFAARLGSGFFALSVSLSVALPTLAADPFRTSNPHEISTLTETAFEAVFKEGNYVKAREILSQPEAQSSGDPLVQAMQASVAYLDNDFAGVTERARATKQAAIALEAEDPLRSHLYQAVGIFMEGASILKAQGVARGTPMALGMLQQVFNHLDEAEAIDPDDPELNLIKGYMDLMLAVNLPFSNPEEAISRMEQYGSPTYLSQRGIAIGYRDLDRNEEGLAAAEKALSAAPDNPELHYLKGQLLLRLGRQGDSAESFNEALEYKDQLPPEVVKRITFEGCVAEGESGDTCTARAGYD